MYLFSCNAQREISSTLERSVRSSIIQIESTIVSLRCPLVWRVKCGETGTCRVRIVTSSSGLSCAMRSAQLALGTCARDKTVQVLGTCHEGCLSTVRHQQSSVNCRRRRWQQGMSTRAHISELSRCH